MNISIENVKNVKRVSLEIEDWKFNILVGGSGSGKSSIKEALCESDIDRLQSVYCTENPIISVNGQPVESSQYAAFDDDFKKGILIDREKSENSDIYDIFVRGDREYREYIDYFNASIVDLLVFKNEMERFLINVGNVEKEILKMNGDKIHGSSKIKKFEAQSALLSKKEISSLKSYSTDYYNWLQKGLLWVDDTRKCPYCHRKMTSTFNGKVDFIGSLKLTDFKILEISDPILRELNIEKPNFFKNREVAKLKNEIIRKIEIGKETQKILEYIETYSNITDFNNKYIPKLSLRKIIYEEYHQLESIIISMNENIKIMNLHYSKYIKKVNNRIKGCEKKLNMYMVDLGIPYTLVLEKFDNQNRKAQYKLYHISDSSKNERTFGLSYGEKNIISLLLFLTRQDQKTIIIDDPASSFDEYKRKTIYEIMISLCKGKTTILLSHDFVFAKFAVYDKSKKMKLSELGNIFFMENFIYSETAILKNIESSDFMPIQSHIIEHLLALTDEQYYSKIVSLRILFEPNRRFARYKVLYGYLSAILHHKSNEIITQELTQSSLSEVEAIQQIKDLLISEYGCNINIDLFDYSRPIDSNISVFDKLMLYRETCNDTKTKQELSSIIHLNEAQVIQLNPYKFNYFSKKLYDSIIV